MALYAIGDTHLSESSNKPMDIFGGAWRGYRQKLLDGLSVLTEEDTLIIAGDFSWGINLKEALPDFQLLDNFPGKKLILKGNHDYWWETMSKMNLFFCENGIKTFDFLHNNSFLLQNKRICGTRGWFYDKKLGDSQKMLNRELMRLEHSLKSAQQADDCCELICFLHYPPLAGDAQVKPLLDLLSQYNVSRCFYGHLHGEGLQSAFNGQYNGITFECISADAIDFKPILIK